VDVPVFDPDLVPLCEHCEAAGTARLLVRRALGSPDGLVANLWLRRQPEADPGADPFLAPSLN
jgi:hypothetical protein